MDSRSIDYRLQSRGRFAGPRALVLSVLYSTALTASAHDTWLQPRRTSVPSGTIAQLDLASGDRFPVPFEPIRPDRVDSLRARLNGKMIVVATPVLEKKALECRVALPDPGIAAVWLSLAPKSLELRPRDVKHYLDEIDAAGDLRQVWESSKGSRWREVSTKHAKTFVRVGRPKSDLSWNQAVGMALEVVPEKDPTTLRAGDDFPVRVLKNGSPLADFSLGIVREGHTNRSFKKTDPAGRAVFKLARSGHWMLRGTELRRSNKPATDWESHFTTLTFEVH
ncbi:MAG: DUF4198 domain-containing protein [Burkholderiaceae bacterium]